MADQDFDINIRTTADTSGIAKTAAALHHLNADVARQLAAAGAYFDPATNSFKPIKPPPVTPGPIRPPPPGGGGGLGGIGGLGFGRVISQFFGATALLSVINQVKTVADELTKITKELEKQGAQLIENSQLSNEAAKGVRNEADAIKVADSALKDVRQAHRGVIEAQNEELSPYEKITDAIYHALTVGRARAHMTKQEIDDIGRVSKKSLDARIEGQRQLEDLARQELSGAIRSSKANEEAFDRRKAEPFQEAIKKTTENIIDLTAQLKSIDYTQFPENWVATSKNIERAKKDLKELIDLEKQREEDRSKLSPQAQRVLMNEQAARTAREQGRDRDADLFQKSIEQFERSATPAQKAELERFRRPPGEGALEAAIKKGGLSDPELKIILKDLLKAWQ